MKNTSVANSRNSAPRKRSARTERLGYILFDNQTATVPCRVREFSNQGAVLTMDGWMGVPDSFSLFVDPENSRYTCKVISQRGNSAKVSFAA
ncbi:MAG: hypothetical protein GY761_21035 [Hyphomicrobiales bacterium]|nr:hypothetical protein [Hyphomicrobiales bacterium]